MRTRPGAADPEDAPSPDPGAAAFGGLFDIMCPVSVVLGTGRISVRECLRLSPRHVLPLKQAAGEDLVVFVGEVAVAKGEVVIMEDSTAIRLTEVLKPTVSEGR